MLTLNQEWVGLETSWTRLLLKTKSQNKDEETDLLDSVCQLMSRKLKSPIRIKWSLFIKLFRNVRRSTQHESWEKYLGAYVLHRLIYLFQLQ